MAAIPGSNLQVTVTHPVHPDASRQKLLIISYLFPPNGGIAVQRALSLAKYLPPLGYDVHVLTAANASGPVRDSTLTKHIPPEVKVHSALALEVPFHFRQVLWRFLSTAKQGNQPSKPASTSANKAKPPVLSSLVRRVLCPEP